MAPLWCSPSSLLTFFLLNSWDIASTATGSFSEMATFTSISSPSTCIPILLARGYHALLLCTHCIFMPFSGEGGGDLTCMLHSLCPAGYPAPPGSPHIPHAELQDHLQLPTGSLLLLSCSKLYFLYCIVVLTVLPYMSKVPAPEALHTLQSSLQ